MTKITTNIFALEFIINNLNVWILPDGLVEINKKCVDFTFLNIHTIICERDLNDQKNGTIGKICLFTLDKLPSNENMVLK